MKLIEAQQQGIAPWTNELPESTDSVAIYFDKYPVSKGHTLYVPRHDDFGHVMRCFELAYRQGSTLVSHGFCDAYNVGMNNGEAAGQTIRYPHVHMIPRWKNDTADPVGGVRRVIEGQGNYHVAGYIHPESGAKSDLEDGTVTPEFAYLYSDFMVPDMEPGSYPGLTSDRDIEVIAEIMHWLPKGNEPVVEIGMFLGKSTMEIAKHRDVYSVDYFQMPASLLLQKIDKAGIHVNDIVRNAKSQRDMVTELTRGVDNIHIIVDTFDDYFKWEYGPIACAFEDSDHREPTMRLFFEYWWPRIIPGGVICGHDYHMPAVQKVVLEYAEKLTLTVKHFEDSNMWAIRKPS